MLGGYKGKFSVLPYYQKIQEYNNYESRDLWEYKLNFSKNEIKMLELLLWEVGWTYIDYYYLDDNCAYVMLALLEAAKPDLFLTNKALIYAIPSDTIRIVDNIPNFVTNVTYRPSVLSRYVTKVALLNNTESIILKNIVENNNILENTFSNCDKYCKANVIDSKLEFIDYKEKLVGSNDLVKYGKLRHTLLLSRAKDAVKLEKIENKPQSNPPHIGHDSGMVAMSVGSVLAESYFTELQWRPALHNYEDSDLGYSNSLGIGFLDTTFRYNVTDKKFELRKFHLLEIMSLPKNLENIEFLAWHFDLGLENNFGFNEKAKYERGYLKFGVGATLFGEENNRFFYSLLHLDTGYSRNFGWHFGPNFLFGYVEQINSKIKFIVTTELGNRFNKNNITLSSESKAILSYYISRNFSVQLSYLNKNSENEAKLTTKIYF